LIHFDFIFYSFFAHFSPIFILKKKIVDKKNYLKKKKKFRYMLMVMRLGSAVVMVGGSTSEWSWPLVPAYAPIKAALAHRMVPKTCHLDPPCGFFTMKLCAAQARFTMKHREKRGYVEV
jgi:hypothetical protein